MGVSSDGALLFAGMRDGTLYTVHMGTFTAVQMCACVVRCCSAENAPHFASMRPYEVDTAALTYVRVKRARVTPKLNPKPSYLLARQSARRRPNPNTHTHIMGRERRDRGRQHTAHGHRSHCAHLRARVREPRAHDVGVRVHAVGGERDGRLPGEEARAPGSEIHWRPTGAAPFPILLRRSYAPPCFQVSAHSQIGIRTRMR